MSDITYVPTDEGWLYLAGHKDLIPASEPGVNNITVNGVSAGSFTVQDNRASDFIFWASSAMVILALILAVVYTWRRREGYYD